LTIYKKNVIIFIENEREEKTMLKILGRLVFIIMMILMAWFAVSYMEIVIKNCNNPIYSSWNLITMLMNN
jgi:hypothetical protein